MSEEKTEVLNHSESHPRLLDIDSSLEKIDHVEHTESHVQTYNQDRSFLNEINKNFEFENLSTTTRDKAYHDRLEFLKAQMGTLNLQDVHQMPDDNVDKYCDPNNPVRITFNDVSSAAYRIKGGIDTTPCTHSHMSAMTGMEIYLKKDFLLYTGSFKERGARNALLNLSKAQKLNGVIAASAGNHALALAYHGRSLKIPVVVVMPNYDHPHILAGQGTMALEIIEQVPDVDAIVVPTGGGGLLAGIAVAAKALKPDITIISAESDGCPGFFNSMLSGKPTWTRTESTLADGLAVSLVGYNSFATASPLVDKCVTVSEEYIAIAILRLLELEKAVVEGAGACGLAAILQGCLPELKNKKVVIPICGGNIDTSVLGRVLERALVADSRLIKMWVTVSDRPGSLAEFCKVISNNGGSIKDMAHERAWIKNDIFSVQVQVVLEVQDGDSAKALEEAVRAKYDKIVMGPYGLSN